MGHNTLHLWWTISQEDLLSNASSDNSVHAELRMRLSGDDSADIEDDSSQGWMILMI